MKDTEGAMYIAQSASKVLELCTGFLELLEFTL